MNYEWKIKEPSRQEVEASEAFGKELGISPILAGLLRSRGISTLTDAKNFFRPQLSQLLDPFLFKDMSKAVARLNEALARNERVLVYGDYDVDGVTAVLGYKFCCSSIQILTTIFPIATRRAMVSVCRA